MNHVAPSILAADFARLGEQVLEVERAGANRIHIDVMDGHFGPNLSMGPAVVQALRKVTGLPLEVHLMIDDPEKFTAPFLKAGADHIIFHYEILPDPRPLIATLHAQGKKAGVAVKPKTPVEVLGPFLPEMDLALCMTVEPGFGGQEFLPESPPRIQCLRRLIAQKNPACELEVDGGIDEETTPLVVRSGANVLVAGSAVFHVKKGPAAAVRDLQALADRASGAS